MIPSTERTTPAQWTVIAWTAIVILAVIGVVALYASSRVDVLDDVVTARWVGISSLALAAAVWALKRLVGRFLG